MEGSVYTREYQVFLEQLRTARDRSGCNQRELARRLGKSRSYVAKLETGYSRMDIYQIRTYLDAIGVPFLDFMTAYETALIGGLMPEQQEEQD